MTTKEIQDYFIAVWPEGVPVDDPVTLNNLMALAVQKVYDQYTGDAPPVTKPLDVRITAIAWLFTSDPEEVERSQPAHDCEECKAGNRRAQEYLRANPGRTLALADMTYVEEW